MGTKHSRYCYTKIMYLKNILSSATLAVVLIANSATNLQAGENDPLQIIDLKNRPATEVIPVIKPLLNADDGITGTGYKLFIRTDKNTLEEVTRLLQAIDTAPKNLLISVRNDAQSHSKSSDFDVSGNYEIGSDGRVIVGNRPPKESGTNVRYQSNRSDQDSDSEHRIRVIEGGKAFITAGEIRPYEHRTIIKHRHGISIYDSVDYQDVTSGFYVSPQLTGNGEVMLHVQPHYRSASDAHSGQVDVQEAETSITTSLGKWTQIGGVDTTSNSTSKGFINKNTNRSDKQSTIYIKVDIDR